MQVIQKKSQNVPVSVTKLSISSGAISVSPKGFKHLKTKSLDIDMHQMRA